MTNQFSVTKRLSAALASAAAIALSFSVSPAFAGDPFRTSDARDIGDNTEAAFEAIFKEGNYQEAKRYLSQAEASEPNEPLAHAMRASLAYTEEDWNGLKTYATKTLESAEKLQRTDPLRGNLYTAVGNFLEGAYNFKEEGPIRSLAKLQQVFKSLDQAKAIAPNDPELNLLTGFMDLMLAVNLPFSDASQAIQRLESNAAPNYVSYRGIAVGYRDLDQLPKALDYVDRAIASAPSNPDLMYLKAQILAKQKQYSESLKFFDRALAKRDQLLRNDVAQIVFEQCRAQSNMDSINRDCYAELVKVKEGGN
jgi:tetratricopeptide (TPR) repeat protein